MTGGLSIADVVDVGKLTSVVIAALVAGVGVTVLFSLAILGLTRVSDTRTRGSGATSTVMAWACLGVLSLAGCVAAVIYGLVLLTS